MSDTIEGFKALADHRKALRAVYGVECPMCKKFQPKAFASILLPQQRCKVDSYRDPRPELTDEQWANPNLAQANSSSTARDVKSSAVQP
jgi:hypothetical protein